jgi:hypothetical protein
MPSDKFIRSLQEQIGYQNIEAQMLRKQPSQAPERVPFGTTFEAHVTTLRDAYQAKEQEQSMEFLNLTEENAVSRCDGC